MFFGFSTGSFYLAQRGSGYGGVLVIDSFVCMLYLLFKSEFPLFTPN